MLRPNRSALQAQHDPEKWEPVSRLREAQPARVLSFEASAGEGRSDNIMLKEQA
jgi:hypothetical protein